MTSIPSSQQHSSIQSQPIVDSPRHHTGTPLRIVELYVDGASYGGNPGRAVAYWATPKGHRGQQDLGQGTNNLAEISAIWYGMQDLIDLCQRHTVDPQTIHLTIHTDSQTVRLWLSGSRVGTIDHRDRVLEIIAQIRTLDRAFGQVEIVQIPRAQNLAHPSA